MAIASLRRASELDPRQAAAFVNLGHVYQSQGRYVDAADSCRRAIELKPDFALAHNNLGRDACQAGGQGFHRHGLGGNIPVVSERS